MRLMRLWNIAVCPLEEHALKNSKVLSKNGIFCKTEIIFQLLSCCFDAIFQDWRIAWATNHYFENLKFIS